MGASVACAEAVRLPPLHLPLPALQGGVERQQQSKLVDRLLAQNADDIVDIGRAIGKFEAAAREERHRLKNKVGQGAVRLGRCSVACTSATPFVCMPACGAPAPVPMTARLFTC